MKIPMPFVFKLAVQPDTLVARQSSIPRGAMVASRLSTTIIRITMPRKCVLRRQRRQQRQRRQRRRQQRRRRQRQRLSDALVGVSGTRSQETSTAHRKRLAWAVTTSVLKNILLTSLSARLRRCQHQGRMMRSTAQSRRESSSTTSFLQTKPRNKALLLA